MDEGQLGLENNIWNHLNCVQTNDWYLKELVAIEKGAFGSPSTKVAYLTYL